MNEENKTADFNSCFVKIGKLAKNLILRLEKLIVSDKELIEIQEEEKNTLKLSILNGLSIFIIFAIGPLLLYGAYMFLSEGDLTFAILEILAYFVIVIIIFAKQIKIDVRNLILMYLFYFYSILLLLATANCGAGMICIIVVMFLSGLLLETKKIIYLISVNIIVFVVITLLLFNGVMDGKVMENYKSTWFINMLTMQISGIGLMLLVHSIYKALCKKNLDLVKSKELLAESEKQKLLYLSSLVESNNRRYELIVESKKNIEYTSIHDSLTGLYNRNYYNSFNEKDFKFRNIAVFMCDVDDLKFVNDNYGHLEGDKIIKAAAEVLTNGFRECDTIARIGGDEFVAIASNCNDEEAKQLVKRIEKSIIDRNKNVTHKLSLSVGYFASESSNYVLADMIKEADNLMYRNKRIKKQNLKQNHKLKEILI